MGGNWLIVLGCVYSRLESNYPWCRWKCQNMTNAILYSLKREVNNLWYLSRSKGSQRSLAAGLTLQVGAQSRPCSGGVRKASHTGNDFLLMNQEKTHTPVLLKPMTWPAPPEENVVWLTLSWEKSDWPSWWHLVIRNREVQWTVWWHSHWHDCTAAAEVSQLVTNSFSISVLLHWS